MERAARVMRVGAEEACWMMEVLEENSAPTPAAKAIMARRPLTRSGMVPEKPMTSTKVSVSFLYVRGIGLSCCCGVDWGEEDGEVTSGSAEAEIIWRDWCLLEERRILCFKDGILACECEMSESGARMVGNEGAGER